MPRDQTKGIEDLTDLRSGDPLLCHYYPKDPHYRRSGQSPPHIGDVAWCGWVKKHPSRGPEAARALPDCIVCVDLRRRR